MNNSNNSRCIGTLTIGNENTGNLLAEGGKMKKNILQTVSGGYDSTCLLIKNLQEGHEVFPLYINAYSVHPAKRLVEITTVRNLIKTLQVRFDKLRGVTVVDNKQLCIRGIISMQPLIWLLGLFAEVKKRRDDVFFDEVHIAYIMGDSAVSFQKELQAFWKALFSFSFPETDKYPKLVFPLLKCCKEIIINELSSYDYSILASCWTCENPHVISKKSSKSNDKHVYIEPCGACRTCTNLKATSPFRTPKRYKATFNADKFSKDHNSIINRIINETDIFHIPEEYLSIEETNDKMPVKRKPHNKCRTDVSNPKTN